jgi:hypothetical protein
VHNNPINFNDPNGLFANQVSNAWSAWASYFNTNPAAAFGGGLGAGVGYGLATLTVACPLCEAAASGSRRSIKLPNVRLRFKNRKCNTNPISDSTNTV